MVQTHEFDFSVPFPPWSKTPMDPGSSHAAFAASGILRVNVLAHVPVEINRETQEKKNICHQ